MKPETFQLRSFLSRERAGWILYDWANSAYVLCVVTVLGSAYFLALFDQAARDAGAMRHGPALALPLAGIPITAEAAWSFIIGGSALLVALSSPLLGALADGTGSKKRFLQVYCFIGVATTLALWLPLPWWAVGLLIAASNVGFEGGNVFYNAFLPEIAGERERNLLSSAGYAAGYLGGVLVLIVSLAFFVPPRGTVNNAFLLIGLWWGGFALISFATLKERAANRGDGNGGALGAAWREVVDTVRNIARYPHAARFLGAFLLYNNGIATIISNATPFALQNIYVDDSLTEKISLPQLIPVIIMIQVVAVPGTLACGWVADRIGQRGSIFLTLAVFAVVITYGQVVHVLGEFYVMAALIGLVLGGAQAISRSLFASLIPAGKHAEFFSFFALSGRFSGFAGPIIYGAVLVISGNARTALLSLSVFFVAGAALLYTVDPAQGRADALNSRVKGGTMQAP